MINKQIPSKKQPLCTYDQEWVQLILEAKKSGLSPIQVRNFLKNSIQSG